MINTWYFWVIIYLIASILFAHTFKKANRNMKDATKLTILLEVLTAFFAILFIPLFEFKLPDNINIYITLFIVTVLYAITDRLNIEVRYGLDPSIFSMFKQTSSVYLIIFSFIFFHESFGINKIIGTSIIVLANIIIFYEKGKLKFNKYYFISFLANFLFAIGMLINVNISNNFNLGVYTICTVLFPAIYLILFSKNNLKYLKEEYNLYDKKGLITSAFLWCVMLVSSVRAYQLGNMAIIASLFSITTIINSLIELIFYKNKDRFIQKLIAGILTVVGVILIKNSF